MDYNSSIELVEIPQKQLMSDARAALSGRWGLAVAATLVYVFISGAIGIIPFAGIFIAGPFALGLAEFSLKLSRGESAEVGDIFNGFKNFGSALGTHLLMLLAIIVGMLFFIVPGIILALGLSQVMYILAEEPSIKPVEALKKSWEMTKGHKMDLFILILRFLPWFFLSMLTLFIGLFWLIPYMQVTFANFYRALREEEGQDDDDISRHLVGNLE